MLDIEWTPVRIIPTINDAFRIFALFLFAVLAVIIIINAD
ncbi:hypothetical protein DesyoDRAFT_3231 [Desulfosporosinus youngiae DSM 17734]|uniref:Uncharacterized protein n=1 Tax=Desulfosporosinus youngiae DSM 17734 TaxID=768710 RepID=H5XVV7_9FIRM|nr:hypothetical protein DesyoDRAFT_3231 [Desulfosporosinus youngiae DSM 17734]